MSSSHIEPLSAVAAADAAAVAARIITSNLEDGPQHGCEQCTDAAPSASPSRSPTASPPPDAWTLSSMLSFNHDFVLHKKFEPYLTDRFPFKKLVIVTCMDTRLVELLPMSLGIRNGDAKIIKVAGAIVTHPFGSVMRSILVAVYALGAEHILVVGHHDCGMTGLDPNKILTQAKLRGIPESTFKTLNSAGLNLGTWLSGFDSVQSSVLHSVDTIRNHPLLHFEQGAATAAAAEMAEEAECPASVPPPMRVPKISVTGLVICPRTGRLDLLTPTTPELQKRVDEQRAVLEKAGLVDQEESQPH